MVGVRVMFSVFFTRTRTVVSDPSGFISLSAQLEIAQKHPDIYAVPVKLPKPNLNRPQPIGWVSVWGTRTCLILTQNLQLSVVRSNAEPQAMPRLPYSESRGQEDREVEYRRQLSDQARKGYYNPQKYNDTELWGAQNQEVSSAAPVPASLNFLLTVTFPAETSASTLISDFILFLFLLFLCVVQNECFRPEWLILLLMQEMCKYSVCQLLFLFVNPASSVGPSQPSLRGSAGTNGNSCFLTCHLWIFQALKGT